MAEGKHTPGPVKATRAKHPDNTGGYDYAVSDQDNCIIAECFQHVGYAGGTAKQYIEFPAAENAALIAEAFNVATETSLTPYQLAAERDRLKEINAELLAALMGLCLGTAEMEDALWGHLPDDQTGTHTFRLGALRKARAAISRATVTP